MNYRFQLSGSRPVREANYNTFVHPALHPDRIMNCHDFLYIIDGTWEIALETAPRADSSPIESGAAIPNFPESLSDREILLANTGDLMILPANLRHYGTAPCSPNCRNMYIHTEVLPGDLPSEDMSPDSSPVAGSSVSHVSCTDSSAGDTICFPSVIHCFQNQVIPDLFSEIITVYWNDSPLKQKKLSCLFELLLCEIKEQQVKSPAAFKHYAFVDSVAKYLHANPQTFFTASEVAEHFSVSERTLNNRFREIHQKTLYTYQMEQKLEMVRQFLRANSGITLRETASNFGFYDEFHLSKAFKKYFGMSPKYMR